MSQDGISILVTTWERAEYLRLCLLGYLRQTEGDFEIIISDDGSTDPTPEVVDEFKKRAPFPVTYLWRPHDGHRRAEVINRAIVAAKHDWLLFSDCDSVPKADLVEVHRREADPRRLLCGGCVRLDQARSAAMTPEKVLSGEFETYISPIGRRKFRRKHLINLFYIAIRKARRPHNLALNMSCSKRAMIEINGYDQNFRGWGNADGDVRDRLRKIGVTPKSVVHKALVFHLWHPEHPTRRKRLNRDYARRTKVPARCEVGIDSLPRAGGIAVGEDQPSREPNEA